MTNRKTIGVIIAIVTLIALLATSLAGCGSTTTTAAPQATGDYSVRNLDHRGDSNHRGEETGICGVQSHRIEPTPDGV